MRVSFECLGYKCTVRGVKGGKSQYASASLTLNLYTRRQQIRTSLEPMLALLINFDISYVGL